MGLKAFAGGSDDVPLKPLVVRATDAPPSPFAGLATDARLNPFAGRTAGPVVVPRGDGTLLDWWLNQARGFVQILEEWADPDNDDSWYDEDEDVTYTPAGPDMTLLVVIHPPGRKLSRITLKAFRIDTGRLAGEVVAGLSDRLVEPILRLCRIIDEAVSEIRAGGSFRLDAVRLAFRDAEVICHAIKTAVARKRAQALPTPSLMPPTGPAAAPVPAHLPRSPAPSGDEAPAGVARTSRVEPPAGRPHDEIDLAEMMRRDHPRAGVPIAFLEYMRGRPSASYGALAVSVHRDEQTSDCAIRAIVSRVNRFLEGKALRLRFRCGSGHVMKFEDPE